MNFKEHLDYINKDKEFYLGKALIADELWCQSQLELTDEQFEDICDYAYDYYLNSGAPANEIIRSVLDVIEDIMGRDSTLTLDYVISQLWEHDDDITNAVCYCW